MHVILFLVLECHQCHPFVMARASGLLVSDPLAALSFDVALFVAVEALLVRVLAGRSVLVVM